MALPVRTTTAAIFAVMLAACAAAPQPGAPQSAARANDCLEIGVYSNGFHASVIAPRDALEADHPFRRLYGEARWFVAGWGDEAFFRESGGGTLVQGLRAAIPGGPTVIQLIATSEPPEQYFASGETVRIAVSSAQAAGLARYLRQEIELSSYGDLAIVAPGHHAGRSVFLRGRDHTFSLFNNCNHWTARALGAAGVEIRPAATAGALLARARRLSSSCPHGAP
jgi:uncharacterized protein (TIGR02117 family)